MKIYLPVLLVCITSLCEARSILLARHEPALHRREAAEAGPVSDSDQDLINKLAASDMSTTAAKANGAKSYMIDQSSSWTVGANEECQAEIGPKQTFAGALLCSAEGGAACKVTAAIKNTESFTNTMGFTTSFSIEASGKIGAATVKVAASQSQSNTYAHTYGQETSISYEFPVPAGKGCTPTRVSYRMKCKGTSWHVIGEEKKFDCDKLTDPIDFSDQLRIFKGDDGHYFYVNHRSDGKSELYEMLTFENRYRPNNCGEVTGGVWVRQMDVLLSADTEEPLSFTDGKSLSAMACIFTP
ncbi:hypothetical protein BGZ93_000639 [Podila epicladia]|nr:hypothetical protein BGZ92_003776 [Podila epicladia]KAG0098267.1 hypothetical protein BGZ93_000639 [Podila epicladia]